MVKLVSKIDIKQIFIYQLLPSDAQGLTGSLQPININEDEELERISGLVQRDALIRSLGIIEHVHRLLHCRTSSSSTLPKPSLMQVTFVNY